MPLMGWRARASRADPAIRRCVGTSELRNFGTSELWSIETPNAKRKTPNAKRQTPNAKRQTPNAKPQTPNAGTPQRPSSQTTDYP
ncbi:hypothetical protein, partial [Burkholderia pseudomallei]|uniref:hypothetical protein n=1 Tax=Burkholderia pseudomallei TaxID=28450 RepID=UPI0030820501